MDIQSLYNLVENTSQSILQDILSAEQPIGDFYSVILNRWADWIFLFLATVIGAIVAVNVDRKFRENKKIYSNKLVKEAFRQSSGVTFTIFVYLLIIGVIISLVALAINFGKKYSASLTILLIVIILFIIYKRKQHKKKKLLERLRKK